MNSYRESPWRGQKNQGDQDNVGGNDITGIRVIGDPTVLQVLFNSNKYCPHNIHSPNLQEAKAEYRNQTSKLLSNFPASNTESFIGCSGSAFVCLGWWRSLVMR